MSSIPLRVLSAWICGFTLVIGGVALKRVVAPALIDKHDQAWVAIAGLASVTIGLGCIAVGISVRNRIARLRCVE